ncbi:g6707 [Coccomyxa viridis]|uniref:G6707 protein n=1 Tax=Coccomyxa viridis TaxID=1274662 RepID=A0ABP1FX95_9CHLO
MLMGGEQVRWREYKRAMAQGGFSAAWPLYIASGILTYGDKAGLQNVRANLGSHFGSSFHYKELYLHKNTLAGLNAEQNALIDFLILIKCNKFVGFSPSTFSYFIREYRTLTGVQQDRSHLLKVPSINSEILFNATAVIS